MFKFPESKYPHKLRQRHIKVILDGPYGSLVSKCRETREKRIGEIASLYTRQELLQEAGFGLVSVAVVKNWLLANGRRFRHQNEPIEAVICSFDFECETTTRSLSRKEAV